LLSDSVAQCNHVSLHYRIDQELEMGRPENKATIILQQFSTSMVCKV